ncbi:MAG: cytochrome ubiquinol oxidase subunit I [Chloroflexi bacterium HGW-Chloroflexi-2]|jgi:cytochrome d ubiquinol oxidase subunit I|nr:MAG: cytochrome ubiquinol oxidase subunit I [Chloroflexi bacterium HGW-Chloroflexi-2]
MNEIVITLSRWQFALTTVYHFFFVPLTIGLALIVAIMQTIYFKTGDQIYKQMTKYWGKLFLINFAMGVVTGIVMEFQFGMNWSEYSRFVGDIFGAPLAIEALLAFFLESTFIGVWVFGWDKISKRLHLISIWLVAIGSTLSAFWILVANSFMQSPMGFVLENGRMVMNDFGALVSNPNVWVQFTHTVLGGYTTGAMFILGISAYFLFRKEQVDLFQKSFQIATIIGLISVFLVILVGHSQGQHMVKTQPMKMAAAEALWESENPASFSIISIVDQKNQKDVFSIRIPAVLSLLSYNRFEGEVRGIKDIQSEYEQIYGPGNYIPPITINYWSFRVMVGSGFLMFFLTSLGLYLVMKKKVLSFKLIKYFPFVIVLPYLANTCGWILTEVGRQPWVVFGYLQTSEAISPNVTVGMLWLSVIGFTVIYGALMAVDVYLLSKYAKKITVDEPKRTEDEKSYWE